MNIGVHGPMHPVVGLVSHAVRAASAIGALASFQVSGLEDLVASVLVIEVRVVIEGRLA
jgi:hypothetical protein